MLDRGKSPTQHLGVEQINGEWIFTNPTTFTILPNAYFHTEENSTVTIDNGSALTVQSGGRLELHGQMLIRNQGKLVIEDGAIVALHRGAKIISDIFNTTSATIGNKNNLHNRFFIFATAFGMGIIAILRNIG